MIKKGKSMKKKRPHPLAPEPYDPEKVKRVLARLPMKTMGDDSGADGLPRTVDLPIGGVVVVEFRTTKP